MATDATAAEADDPRDWREWAYVRAENWPEAIPWTGPKREYGPYPWGRPDHDDPHGLDTYPHTHPDAASVGENYLGDVCPYCGTPLRWDEVVVQREDGRGRLCDLDDPSDPTPSYHPQCAAERRQELHRSFGEFTE